MQELRSKGGEVYTIVGNGDQAAQENGQGILPPPPRILLDRRRDVREEKNLQQAEANESLEIVTLYPDSPMQQWVLGLKFPKKTERP